MSLFEADDLIRLAGRIDEQATALRAKARGLSAAAHQARWHSPAADTFRAEVSTLDRRVQHAAHNLERAAHELRAHAARVRAVQTALAAAARLERLTLTEAEHVLGGATRLAVHTGAGAVRTLEHARDLLQEAW